MFKLSDVLKEIRETSSNKQRSLSKYLIPIEKELKKSIGEFTSVNVDGAQNIILDDGEGGLSFDVVIEILSKNLFELSCVIGGQSGKKYKKINLTLDDILKWIKTDLKKEIESMDKNSEEFSKKVKGFETISSKQDDDEIDKINKKSKNPKKDK